jgi:hypothetical protein
MDIGRDTDHTFGWWHNVGVGSTAEVLEILTVSIFKASNDLQHVGNATLSMQNHQPKKDGENLLQVRS